jgi:DNA-directed RNA polymerase subunit H (RpoH/RPB5)
MDNLAEKAELYKIYTNIKELLLIRNYKTDYKFDISKNNILIENYININAVSKDNKEITILFIINSDANIIKKSDVFLKYISNLEKKTKDLDKIIIISKYKLSSNLNKKIKLLKKNITIENILFSILIFNPMKHINYNNYTFSILSDEEKKNLFELIDYDVNSINKICIDDPICIYYDFNVNDIIKIIKPTIKTAGMTCCYRLVINKHIGINRTLINKTLDVIIEEEEEEEEEKIDIEEEEEQEQEQEQEQEEEDIDAYEEYDEDVDLEEIEEIL